MISEEFQLEVIKKAMLSAECNPLMIPSALKVVSEIPKLGSGKTDFKKARQELIESN